MGSPPGHRAGCRIFICYRRDDTAGYAGRAYDALAAEFGEPNVFMDIDAIDPGTDFAEVIAEALSDCDVLLVLIGPNWLARRGLRGRRRVDTPGDFVRLELAAAMDRDIPIVCRCSSVVPRCPAVRRCRMSWPSSPASRRWMFDLRCAGRGGRHHQSPGDLH